MDKFLLASNPLKPFSQEYVLDTINQLMFEVVNHSNKPDLQLVKSLIPMFKEDHEVLSSLNNAKRWYAGYVNDKLAKTDNSVAELESETA